MKIIYLITILLVILGAGFYYYPDYAIRYSTLLRLDTNAKTGLPSNFRITPLRASGSAQFSETQLPLMLQEIPHEKVILVDLRGEPHFFLNGDSVSWYTLTNGVNDGKSKEKIKEDDRNKWLALSEKNLAILYRKLEHKPHFYFIKEVLLPENVATKHALEYVRFPVTDHKQPTDAVVNEFIQFYQNLSENVWLHFYCSAGKGRTTTFLAMLDMMQNIPQKTFDEIINAQEFYGGLNLLKHPDPQKWKYPYIVERSNFIRRFYQYCVENPDFSLSWSDWNKNINNNCTDSIVDAGESTPKQS